MTIFFWSSFVRRHLFWPPSMINISVIITHILHYKSCWTFCVGSYSYSYSNSNNPVSYFHWKIVALARIWTLYPPGTKQICYQLSYPGLDNDKKILKSRRNDLTYNFQSSPSATHRTHSIEYNVKSLTR